MNNLEIAIVCSKPYKLLVAWLPRVSMGIALILLLVSIFIIPQLNNTFPRHINILGKVDGYGSKSSVFIFPFVPLILGQLIRLIDKQYKSLLYTAIFIVLTFFSIVVIGHMYLGFILK